MRVVYALDLLLQMATLGWSLQFMTALLHMEFQQKGTNYKNYLTATFLKV